VRFAEWTLDEGRRELLHGQEAVQLTPKAFQLLGLLIENRPRVVAKPEIYERLWPRTFVAEVNLSRLVYELRAALGDDARRPTWIRTARGAGYAFCGLAHPALDAPKGSTTAGWCRVILEDREVLLGEGENVLGRSHEAAVWLRSTSVSRFHARILVVGQTATLEDLGSKNGTTCRGQKVTSPTLLGDGDAIRIGTVELIFRVVAPEVSTETS
jgi:hypothetical protein